MMASALTAVAGEAVAEAGKMLVGAESVCAAGAPAITIERL
ncbi:MAG TPA: hypothetical protein VIZ63_16440 [Povalibacter sp.]